MGNQIIRGKFQLIVQIGNAWIDDNTGYKGIYEYYWTHALNSDETNSGINKYCDFLTGNFSSACYDYQNQGDVEMGGIYIYNIYAPLCNPSAPEPPSPGSVSLQLSTSTFLFEFLQQM